MAHFNGYVCDHCGNVISAEQRTRVTTKYQGSEVNGEYSRDLCHGCVPAVPDEVRLKPLRRRRTAGKSNESAA